MAHIGGEKGKNACKSCIIGNTIDVFDVKDIDNPIESLNVVQMGWERKHLSCALIPNGQDGHPMVAICKLIYKYIIHISLFQSLK